MALTCGALHTLPKLPCGKQTRWLIEQEEDSVCAFGGRRRIHACIHHQEKQGSSYASDEQAGKPGHKTDPFIHWRMLIRQHCHTMIYAPCRVEFIYRSYAVRVQTGRFIR